MRYLLPILMCLICSAQLLSQEKKSFILYFESNEKTPIVSSLNDFETWKNSIDFPIDSIVVSGHTDAVGSKESNIMLAQARVDFVVEYLLSNGSDYSQIREYVFGEEMPLASNASNQGKALNRRVEVEVWAKTPMGVVESIPVDELINPDALKRRLEPSLQRFTIDCARDNEINGKNGTFIHIYKKTLETPDGEEYDGVAVVELVEYSTYSELIFGGVHTMSGNRLLESGGMIFLDIYTLDGRPLEIQRDEKVKVGLPTDSLREDMTLFKGRKGQGDELDWIQESRSKASVSYMEVEDRLKYEPRKTKKNVQIGMGIRTWAGYHMKSVPIYNLDITEFGFINCDRFLNEPNKTQLAVFVENDSVQNLVAYLLFKDIKSMMTARKSIKSNSFYFDGIPREMYVQVLVMNIEGETVLTGSLDCKSDDEKVSLALAPVRRWELSELTIETPCISDLR